MPVSGFRSPRIVALLLACAPAVPFAQDAATPAATFKPEELEQLAAPIALYPDPLLAQVLMASTYPLEVVEAARWQKENPDVKGEAVADAVASQTWDPSVKSLVTFPEVLTMMNEKLDWTQKLGDAFLAQQADLMDSVQRLRAKAQAEGTLKTTKEQKVTTEAAPPPPAGAAPAPAAAAAAPAPAPAAAPAAAATPPPTTVIKIEPADPQVVYVPTYNPTVVYGAWPYPAYPPYYYYPPAYPPGAAFFTFTAGVIVGSALWGNCNWGWGHSDVDININNYNNFNRNNINTGDINRGNVGNNNGKWQHNPEHRKGVGYRDTATQSKYGKGRDQAAVQSREAYRGHAEQGRQQIAQGGATRDLAGNSLGGGNSGQRAQAGNLDTNRQAGQGGARDGGAATRPASGGGAANRPASSGGAATRPSAGGSSFGTSSRQPGAYSGMSNGGAAHTQGQRGAASRSAGGFSRGGGGGGRRR